MSRGRPRRSGPLTPGRPAGGGVMDEAWPTIARRAAEGLGVEPGELILVRDLAGRPEVLREMLLAIEQRGATPLPEILPPDYLRELLTGTPESHLAAWDRHRHEWLRRADRML